jgi:hypothetical protein
MRYVCGGSSLLRGYAIIVGIEAAITGVGAGASAGAVTGTEAVMVI